MINIEFNPKALQLDIKGHAGQEEKGKDIVCSAISILFYTLAQNLHESVEMLQEAPTVTDKDGEGYLRCKPKEEYQGNIALMYKTILTGMQIVADEYPEFVTFKVGG
jgi:uncharacterized protein YsxB (DUF464 family)